MSHVIILNQIQTHDVADMRSTLSPMFTGSKMRQMYDFVATVGQQGANTIKDQIKAKGDNVFEFKELAIKFTVDVSRLMFFKATFFTFIFITGDCNISFWH